MRVTIVGPGRLGRTVAALLSAGEAEVRLVGRGQALPPSEVVWLTVPDLALPKVIADLPEGPIVLHASGATGLEVFRGRPRSGSLHPLMTFPGPEISVPDLTGVPAAIAGDPVALQSATSLALRLGLKPVEVPGDRRLYHAAAVLAGNGATLLIAEACRLLEAAGVREEDRAQMLVPLALRSVQNATPDPLGALTGPIARGEVAVIDEHLRAMAEAGLHDVAELHRTLAEAGDRGLARRRDKR